MTRLMLVALVGLSPLPAAAGGGLVVPRQRRGSPQYKLSGLFKPQTNIHFTTNHNVLLFQTPKQGSELSQNRCCCSRCIPESPNETETAEQAQKLKDPIGETVKQSDSEKTSKKISKGQAIELGAGGEKERITQTQFKPNRKTNEEQEQPFLFDKKRSRRRRLGEAIADHTRSGLVAAGHGVGEWTVAGLEGLGALTVRGLKGAGRGVGNATKRGLERAGTGLGTATKRGLQLAGNGVVKGGKTAGKGIAVGIGKGTVAAGKAVGTGMLGLARLAVP